MLDLRVYDLILAAVAAGIEATGLVFTEGVPIFDFARAR